MSPNPPRPDLPDLDVASTVQQEVARLAASPEVRSAFNWFRTQETQLTHWQMEMARIPAPPFGESARGAWLAERFREVGLDDVRIDDVGNVFGTHPGFGRRYVALSAHIDTVFPANTPLNIRQQGSRIYGPGVSDNGAGVAALLGIASLLRTVRMRHTLPFVFIGNMGEEGEGDLRGMRHLFERGPYRHRIAAAIALEGGGSSAVVTRALGSLRFRVTITGPGGHSWADAGTLNPILLLSQALTRIAALQLPTNPLTTINVGHISGGTSVNSIPESATALLDIRSTDPVQLVATATTVHQIFDETTTPQKTTTPPPNLHIETIGNRPAAALPDDSPLLHTLRAVDRHLTLRTEPRLGSTDANIPLSRGVPAIAIGGGGLGGGIHTLQEWYDPTGRETALRRILLTLLDTLQTTAESHPITI